MAEWSSQLSKKSDKGFEITSPSMNITDEVKCKKLKYLLI